MGGYAEYHYLRPRTNIFKIPGDLASESVVGAGCALITAIQDPAWQNNGASVYQAKGFVPQDLMEVSRTTDGGQIDSLLY